MRTSPSAPPLQSSAPHPSPPAARSTVATPPHGQIRMKIAESSPRGSVASFPVSRHHCSVRSRLRSKPTLSLLLPIPCPSPISSCARSSLPAVGEEQRRRRRRRTKKKKKKNKKKRRSLPVPVPFPPLDPRLPRRRRTSVPLPIKFTTGNAVTHQDAHVHVPCIDASSARGLFFRIRLKPAATVRKEPREEEEEEEDRAAPLFSRTQHPSAGAWVLPSSPNVSCLTLPPESPSSSSARHRVKNTSFPSSPSFQEHKPPRTAA